MPPVETTGGIYVAKGAFRDSIGHRPNRDLLGKLQFVELFCRGGS